MVERILCGDFDSDYHVVVVVEKSLFVDADDFPDVVGVDFVLKNWLVDLQTIGGVAVGGACHMEHTWIKKYELFLFAFYIY